MRLGGEKVEPRKGVHADKLFEVGAGERELVLE